MKKLIAFFSATGNTKKLAENISKIINADLFEIIPLKSYTSKDLDWTNSNSRSSIEMRESFCRPEICNKINNFDDYGVIFLGFPIWWYTAPKIINTFLEQYDWKGKTIIPFATSGDSGMGQTNHNLQSSCKGTNLLEGKRFSCNTNLNELKSWLQNF